MAPVAARKNTTKIHSRPGGSAVERSPISQKAMPRMSRLASVVIRKMMMAERNDAEMMPASSSVPLSSCPSRRPRK